MLTGYLAGAAAGPAVSALAATAAGVRNDSRSWGELQKTVAFAGFFLSLTAALTCIAVTLGSNAVSMSPPLIQLPLLALMVALVGGLVPITALVTGTFFSPAVPFRDAEDLAEYAEMQDSYRSDQWQAPKMWTEPSSTGVVTSERKGSGGAVDSQSNAL